jgi:hypothetical protein
VRSHFYSIVELSIEIISISLIQITIINKCDLITTSETNFRIQFLLVYFRIHNPIEKEKMRERDIEIAPFIK